MRHRPGSSAEALGSKRSGWRLPLSMEATILNHQTFLVKIKRQTDHESEVTELSKLVMQRRLSLSLMTSHLDHVLILLLLIFSALRFPSVEGIPSICWSRYFVIAGWRLQAVSASPVRRVDCVLKYLRLLRSWMRVEGARILPRATTPTAAPNGCLSNKYENKLPAHLAQSVLMDGMAAIPAPSFPSWPCEAFCKQLLLMVPLMWVWNICVRKCPRAHLVLWHVRSE